jgi:hypothetical protein
MKFKQITLAVTNFAHNSDDAVLKALERAEGDLDHDMAVIAWYGDGLSPDHFNGKCDTCNRREPLNPKMGDE